jgi:hypothetical protein
MKVLIPPRYFHRMNVGIRVTAKGIISEVRRTRKMLSRPRHRRREKLNAAREHVRTDPTRVVTTTNIELRKYLPNGMMVTASR